MPLRLFTVVTLMLPLLGCRAFESRQHGVLMTDDQVPMHYDLRGAGHNPPVLVFVHCWACNGEFWREQVGPMSRKYDVVTMDLAGHGQSGAGRVNWTISDLGADVARLVTDLDLEDVILVGHSMGGPVALAAAARLPGRVKGVICVDTMHNVEFEFPENASSAMTQRFREDFDGTMQQAVRGMFGEFGSPDMADWVIREACATDHDAAIGLLENFPELDLPGLLANARVPVRAINAVPHGEGSMTTEVAVNRKYADFDATLMDGVGHFLMLEKPREFNAMLDEAIEEIGQRED